MFVSVFEPTKADWLRLVTTCASVWIYKSFPLNLSLPVCLRKITVSLSCSETRRFPSSNLYTCLVSNSGYLQVESAGSTSVYNQSLTAKTHTQQPNPNPEYWDFKQTISLKMVKVQELDWKYVKKQLKEKLWKVLRTPGELAQEATSKEPSHRAKQKFLWISLKSSFWSARSTSAKSVFVQLFQSKHSNQHIVIYNNKYSTSINDISKCLQSVNREAVLRWFLHVRVTSATWKHLAVSFSRRGWKLFLADLSFCFLCLRQRKGGPVSLFSSREWSDCTLLCKG